MSFTGFRSTRVSTQHRCRYIDRSIENDEIAMMPRYAGTRQVPVERMQERVSLSLLFRSFSSWCKHGVRIVDDEPRL